AEHAVEHSAGAEWAAMGLSVVVALIGLGLAALWYRRETAAPSRLALALPRLYRLVLNKYFVDELYFAAFIRPFVKLAQAAAWWDRWIVDGLVNGVRHLYIGLSEGSLAFDRYVVDGAGVNGTAYGFKSLSRLNRKLQTGEFQHYALGFLAGFVLLVIWMLIH
ncbi:MAG: NADH-quinone oxidoreductase subunit L, partial [Acidobacteriota bacterium]